jgi:hypothetical protein
VSAESDARRIAAGPLPSELARPRPPREAAIPAVDRPYDPLHLCVYATIALLGWAAGPVALVVFAALGFTAYWRARRAGLLRSRCFLRDTRLVLAYLAVLTLAGVWGTTVLVRALLHA